MVNSKAHIKDKQPKQHTYMDVYYITNGIMLFAGDLIYLQIMSQLNVVLL